MTATLRDIIDGVVLALWGKVWWTDLRDAIAARLAPLVDADELALRVIVDRAVADVHPRRTRKGTQWWPDALDAIVAAVAS